MDRSRGRGKEGYVRHRSGKRRIYAMFANMKDFSICGMSSSTSLFYFVEQCNFKSFQFSQTTVTRRLRCDDKFLMRDCRTVTDY